MYAKKLKKGVLHTTDKSIYCRRRGSTNFYGILVYNSISGGIEMNNFQRTTMNDVETELRIQKMLTQELVKLPEGRIKTSREGKSYYTGKKGQYKSAAKDIEFITQLRRRRLIEEKLRRIEKNLHWQEKTLLHYKPYDDDSVMRDLPKAYQEMETEQRESIQRIPLENLTDYHAEELVHRTASGELRRSTSEVIISMRSPFLIT